MHKKTRRSKITPKSLKKEAKREIFGGGKVRMWQLGAFIESVGSPFGRCNNVVRKRAALETSRQVARVLKGNLFVRPLVAVHVRTTKLHPFGHQE
jgi:hypothetical protein